MTPKGKTICTGGSLELEIGMDGRSDCKKKSEGSFGGDGKLLNLNCDDSCISL